MTKWAKFTVEGDLRREVTMNIKRLMDLGCYRGPASPQGPALPWSAHPYQCPHPQGSAQGHRWQEVIGIEHGKDCTPKFARRSRRTSLRASPTFTRRSTTPLSPLPTAWVMRCPGRPPVPASAVRASRPVRRPGCCRSCRQGCSECGVKNLEVRIKGPAPAANLLSVP